MLKEVKMELFVKISFWWLSVSTIIKILLIGSFPYPKIIHKNYDIIDVIATIPFIIWTAVLLW